MSAAATADLHDRFVNADQVRQRYSPAQLEVDRMGHHGFFRSRHAGLWDELVLPYLAGSEACSPAEVPGGPWVVARGKGAASGARWAQVGRRRRVRFESFHWS